MHGGHKRGKGERAPESLPLGSCTLWLHPLHPWRSFLSLLLMPVLFFAAWRFRTKAIQDLALIGLLVYALWRARGRFFAAWMNPAGLLALLFAGMVCVQLPFGVAPAVSFNILLKDLDFVALGLALPVLLCTRRRVVTFLYASALAISLLVLWDLSRLIGLYGMDVMRAARMDPNPVLIHPNISALAASVAALLAATVMVSQRRSRPMLVLSLLVVLVNVTYIVFMRSRGAQLALFMGSATMALVSVRGWRSYAVIAIIALLCGIGVWLLNPRFGSMGVLDRDLVWAHTIFLIRQRTWMGYGIGEPVFMQVYHASNPPVSPFYFHHPHMYLLRSLFCYGWPATLVQLAMWVALVWQLIRSIVKRAASDWRIEQAGVLALIVLLQVAGLFDCMPNILGLTLLLLAPLGLAVLQNGEAGHHV